MKELTLNWKSVKSDSMLIGTSAIWGLSFVAQVKGMEFIGPFLFNGIRFGLGAISLIPLILILNKKRLKGSLFPGFISGLILFGGASLQQIGIQFTTAGNAGFITGLYVVLVPIIGIALKHKTGLATWIGATLAVIGLFLISVKNDFSIGKGDLLVLGCSIFFALHVLVIDYFSKRVSSLLLALEQFGWCALFSLIIAIFKEPIAIESIKGATIPILYSGIGSVGIAYTMQIIAQKNSPPAHSAIIMSLESVFAVIGGTLFLAERLSSKGLFGCGIMLVAMLASQWNTIRHDES